MIARCFAALLLAAVLAGAAAPRTAYALGDEPYIGSLELVGFNFCPRGTIEPRGQELPIAQYQVLYSVIGTRHGGDGTKTFKLPNLIEIVDGSYQDKGPVPGMRYCMVIDGTYPARY